LGAFSLGWNVVERPDRKSQITNPKSEIRNPKSLPYLVGLAASLGITLLGNLGIPRMIFQGYQKLAAPPEAVIGEAFFLTRWVWAIRGLFEVLKGETLRYSVGDWYWLPSRAIPAPGDVEPITEFPFFTFLYADLHAHLIALPLTVLALAWVVSVVLARGRWESKLAGGVGFLLGGLAIGALRPTNTWDYPTYLALGVLALVFAIGAHYRPREGSLLSLFPVWVLRGVYATVAVGILVGLSWLLYQPYTQWYALGYTETKIWSGTHTPVSAYFTHWGLFLFLILSWMLWETREWMANTPVSALRKLIPFRETIWGFLVVLLGLIGWLMVYLDVSIAWLVLPLAAWAGVLLLRPGMPDLKRLILFLVGTGFVLTLAVEIVVLSGDIGRMNTVFKFYLQVWALFGISAAASLGWLMKIGRRGVSSPVGKRLRAGWGLGLAVLVFGAFMYPVLGGMAKIEDRMAEDAPHTLDGMAYMPYARYNDNGRDMHLDEDYRAIRWLQENVEGSPVIVEGNTVEYRWGGRYSIYTGLPAVLGWNWHQRQQRTGHDSDVW
ncbi:MAG: DUF2298 domain-containing protein, partial [Anaerolineales bacterium]